MAISLITTIQRWKGLSTDDKPTTDIKEGSTFHEIDTGKRFIWLNFRWQEDISGPISDNIFNMAQGELRRIAENQCLAPGLIMESDAGHYNFTENK